MHLRVRVSSLVFGDTFVARLAWRFSKPALAGCDSAGRPIRRRVWKLHQGNRRNPRRRKPDHQRKTRRGGRNAHTACDSGSNNSFPSWRPDLPR